MTTITFDHRQTAHCESGSFSALLRHNGLDISEAMVFGISSAMSFAYIPLIKLGGMPLISYRMPPGSIIKGVTRRLDIKMQFKRFSNPQAGMTALSNYLESGQPVGLQTSVYWLPYFPKDMRFHFNAHNLVAFGYRPGKSKDHSDDHYLISDPTFEETVEADYPSLQRARFVKGALAPKGLLYYPTSIPAQPPLNKAIIKAIKATTRSMLRTPLPIIGVKGICFISRKIRKLESKHETNEAQNKLYIGHIIRMQEEIGTGGGGFRFLYAAFLQEAAETINNPLLENSSKQFTDIGDEWRRFALYCAKMIKGRMAMDYNKLADQLLHVAAMEESAYRDLEQAIK